MFRAGWLSRSSFWSVVVMQLTATAAVAAWPSLSTPPPRTGGGEKDAAVVVALEDYMTPGVPDVRGAQINGRDWYLYLTGTRGISPARVQLIRDAEATREGLLDAAQKAASQVQPGGLLWFVFIGHGAPSQDGQEGVLVGSDAQQTARGLYARSLKQSELEAELRKGKQRRTLLVLDACFSGKSGEGQPLAPGLQPLLLVKPRPVGPVTVLSAGTASQFAGPLPGTERPAFSYLLLGALRGWGDADGNGEVSAEEAVNYASQVLAVAPIGRTQTPALSGTEPSLILASRAREPSPRLESLFGWGESASAPPAETPRANAALDRGAADALYDKAKYPEALEAYRTLLQKDPLNKDAPRLQQRIVQALESQGRTDEAFSEVRKLVETYAPGTAWHERWLRDAEVVQAVSELVEKSQYSTAIYHHQQALALKEQGKSPQAKAAFETAARHYETFLRLFPRAKTAYEMEFYLADCLYNSLQFGEAGRRYTNVRDSKQDEKYQLESAYSAVLSFQKQLDVDIKNGVEKQYPVLKSTDRREGEKVVPVELSTRERQLVEAADQYVAKAPTGDEKAPSISYRAAELFYRHNQFEEARRRFEGLIATFPAAEVSKFAVNLIVESQLVEKNARGRLAALEGQSSKPPSDAGPTRAERPTEVELLIEKKRQLGDAFQKNQKRAEARKAYAEAVEEFERRNLTATSAPFAAEAAASSAFQIAEYTLADFELLKIGGTGKTLLNSFSAKKEGVKKLNAAYDAVLKYKCPGWSIAAVYRKGQALERFAATILEAPVPADISRLGEDSVIAYRDSLASQSIPLQDKAVEAYELAWSMAQSDRVRSEWTRKTLESLRRLRPKQYGAVKDE